MGNSQSSDDVKPSAESTSSHNRKEKVRESPQSRLVNQGSQNASRKPQATLSHVTQIPPPTALQPTSTAASISTSNAHAQANISASPASSHSRSRSITTGNAKLRAEESASRSPMGNAESRQRPPSRSSTLPPLNTVPPTPSPSSRAGGAPQPAAHGGLPDRPTVGAPLYGSSSDFSRPPRLPLPIERDPEPTSPIITPQDATTPTNQLDENDLVARRASMLSSTTLDDEEVADIEPFELEVDPSAQKVPTTILFRSDAKSVFVTGTFVRWERKHRMHKTVDKDGHSIFTWTAPIPTGTHHIRFLVDGEMIVTDQFLQTVDFTNSLVNYIEIAAKGPHAEQPHVTIPSQPIPIPGTETVVVQDGMTEPIDIPSGERTPETESQLASTPGATIIPVPGSPDQPSQPIPIRAAEPRPQQQQLGPEQDHESKAEPKVKKYLPRATYTTEIPEILLHVDRYNTPDDPDFRRASKAIAHLPQPPSLPMFMSKSILNVTTPHKDDASVLTMPNHTVLNHLATSSIKSGVLATSGTTRYKKKFLTTIMYKPTVDE